MTAKILSSGVVCPGGFGAKALEKKWEPSIVATAAGSRDCEVCLVDRAAPELRRWEKEPRLRRASPISYYLVEAANQALEKIPEIDRQRTGVVCAFFLGCLVYTVRFYRQITTEGRRSASPVLFPETVFNSPLSHVVSVLGLGGPVYSQVGDTSCWSSALRTASTWLARGSADHVIVIGAEEFESHQLDAYQAGGLFRRRLRVGEGAGAILLGREDADGLVTLREVHDGFSFTGKEEAVAAARDCGAQIPSECPVMDTASGWMVPVAAQAVANRRIIADKPGKEAVEAATASCAWHTITAANILEKGLEQQLAIPFWGLSQQCGLALCERPPNLRPS